MPGQRLAAHGVELQLHRLADLQAAAVGFQGIGAHAQCAGAHHLADGLAGIGGAAFFVALAGPGIEIEGDHARAFGALLGHRDHRAGVVEVGLEFGYLQFAVAAAAGDGGAGGVEFFLFQGQFAAGAFAFALVAVGVDAGDVVGRDGGVHLGLGQGGFGVHQGQFGVDFAHGQIGQLLVDAGLGLGDLGLQRFLL